MTVARLKHLIIKAVDHFDAYILRHCLHRFGFCNWIADSSWWGPDDYKYGDEES